MEHVRLNPEATCGTATGPNLRAVRAVIFDVYGTLLEVGPPPSDAEARWGELFRDLLGIAPPLSRQAFMTRANEVIARHHARARARGIAWPEVLWPLVVVEVLPMLMQLTPAGLDTFVHRQMQIERALRLRPGAPRCLRGLRARGLWLGLASNSQPYTQQELKDHLRAAAVETDWFDPALCFHSFEHGFSKPDPHVFQLLTVRLQARGIAPEQTLMVGDRPDNDLEPARAFGWQTWGLQPGAVADAPSRNAGDFASLCAALGLE